MPTYSYRCTECETAFDIHQEFTDDSLTVCPNCGGKLRKLFSAVGVTFNGSGFYRNDSRASQSSSESGGSGSKSSADSGGSSSSAASTPSAPSPGTSTPTSSPSPSKPATSSSASSKKE
jgi:putative FmdB family regulatory protein